MDTDVLLGGDALPTIIKGVDKVGEAVGATMGPRGRNAIIRKRGRTYVTRDGVTVANAFNLPDKREQAGVELLQNAAREVDGLNGDGTTTVTVLTRAILNEALQLIDDGTNPMLLKQDIEKAAQKVAEYVKSASEPIETVEQLAQVATIAAADPEIGKVIANIVWELGPESLVTLRGGQSTRTDVEMVTGVQLESGLASPYLIRDPAAQQTAFEEPYIILCDRSLRDKEDVVPLLRVLHELEGASGIIIAHEIVADALNLITLNSVKGVVDVIAVGLQPEIMDKTSFLQDIAAVTGAKVIGKDNGVVLDNVVESDFGRASSVVAGVDKTVIVRGYGAEEDVERRKQGVLEAKKDTKKFNPDLMKRLSILEGRVAIITIGGGSQSEIEERHYRFEDAVGAAKTALRGGMIPGAGTTLFGASDTIGDTDGESVLALALKQLAIQILDNAGLYTEANFMKLGFNRGFDVSTGKLLSDLRKEGIVDPTESALSALSVAVSTAGLLMTAGSLIVDIEDKNDKTKQ